jgi:hypothetical protein
MKVKVLLFVVTIASLLAALVCAQGIIQTRGGGDPSAGVIIIDRGQPVATGIVIIGPGPRA